MNSSAVFVPLLKLHEAHAQTMFSGPFDPPRESGVLWSAWNLLRTAEQ